MGLALAARGPGRAGDGWILRWAADMTRSCDVAIVGGGIGGLTLAASLLQHSISVEIFEQDTELREIGAGVAISGNATRLLQGLGIDLAQVANMPPAIEFRRWRDGRLLWSHPIGEWYRHEVGAPFLTLHRGTVQRLLAAAVPPECLRLDHRLVGLSDEPAGVRLHFEQGDVDAPLRPSSPVLTAFFPQRGGTCPETWHRLIRVRSGSVASSRPTRRRTCRIRPHSIFGADLIPRRLLWARPGRAGESACRVQAPPPPGLDRVFKSRTGYQRPSPGHLCGIRLGSPDSRPRA